MATLGEVGQRGMRPRRYRVARNASIGLMAGGAALAIGLGRAAVIIAEGQVVILGLH